MSTTAIARTSIPPLSQSRRELMRCSWLYRARVIDGMKESPNEAALRGTEIHQGAKDYTDHLIKTRQASDADWFERNILTRPYRPDALELLEQAHEAKKFVIDPERVLGAEMYLALDEKFQPLDDSTSDHPEECYAYEGTLDRVDIPTRQDAIIHDWKSQFQIVDAEDHYQGLQYSLLLLKHFPDIQTVKFVLHFVRYGTATRDKTYTRAGLPEMEKEVRRQRERQVSFHNEPFEHKATPGKACTFCPLLLKGCPLEANAYSDGPEDLARLLIHAQAQVKDLSGKLKDFCDIAPVRVADGIGDNYSVGFVQVEKASYPAARVLPILNANDPELAAKISLSGLSTPLKTKKRAALRELVEPYKTVTTQTNFKVTGVDEEDDDE